MVPCHMTSLPKNIDLFELYEAAVQDSVQEARFLSYIAIKERGRRALRLREDFCGSFWLCHEWVKLSPQNSAMGIDLNSKAIKWGRKKRPDPLLNARIKTQVQDVRRVTASKFDMIAALNFSYFIFRKRKEILHYFKAVRKSLRPGGILVLDHFGGPAVFEPSMTPSKCKLSDGRRFISQWEEKNFNAATHMVDCAIHFDLPGKRRIKNAFTYPWRLWTLAELKDLLLEAGFKGTSFYFEGEDGRYFKNTTKVNDFKQWIAFVVGRA